MLWWLINLLTAGLTELADDEAYYWFFSWHLDWGYYDHPPMVALLVKLGTLLCGNTSLGVRLFSTLLQPLYLYLFWTLIRPPEPTRRDATIYALICFSIPLLQLYGFMALPDAPLLFFTVVFLWAFDRFSTQWSAAEGSRRLPSLLLLAAAMALLMYSKYHGLLVIVLVLGTYLVECLVERRKITPILISSVAAVLLFLPHLWWQYRHGFPSVMYHLVERHDDTLSFHYLGQTLLNFILVFNPLWFYHYGKGAKALWCDRPRHYAIFGAGIVLFFTLSAFKGPTQPQWMLPAVFPFVLLLFDEARRSDRSYHYIRTVSLIVGALFLLVRLVVIVNPGGVLKGQLWQNRENYQAVANLAGDRPVIFSNSYTNSAKYTFYTGRPAYTLPMFYKRTSQWEYNDLDDSFAHRDVVVAVSENSLADSLLLPSGDYFLYVVVPDFKPLRKVQVEQEEVWLSSDAVLNCRLAIHNPYPYAIYSTPEEPLQLEAYFRITQRVQPEVKFDFTDTLPPGGTLHLQYAVPLPQGLEPGREYPYGFSFRYRKFMSCSNSPKYLFHYRTDR